MTIAHVASDPHLTPIQHDPAAADARCMQQLRTRDASDHLAMYQAGFYVTSDRQLCVG